MSHPALEQLRQLREVLDAPADRVYWYSANDLHDSLSHQEGFHADDCHYHFGLRDQHGRPKLLYRLWASGGFDAIEEIASLQRHHGAGRTRATRVATLPPAVIVPVAEGGGAGTMPSVMLASHQHAATGQTPGAIGEAVPARMHENSRSRGATGLDRSVPVIA